jgi:hypothetical protein
VFETLKTVQEDTFTNYRKEVTAETRLHL